MNLRRLITYQDRCLLYHHNDLLRFPYTPHLPWVHVSHVNLSCISYRRHYSTRTPIILELSTSLPDKAPALVHWVSLTVQEYGRSLLTLTHNLATFVLILGLIVSFLVHFFLPNDPEPAINISFRNSVLMLASWGTRPGPIFGVLMSYDVNKHSSCCASCCGPETPSLGLRVGQSLPL